MKPFFRYLLVVYIIGLPFFTLLFLLLNLIDPDRSISAIIGCVIGGYISALLYPIIKKAAP